MLFKGFEVVQFFQIFFYSSDDFKSGYRLELILVQNNSVRNDSVVQYKITKLFYIKNAIKSHVESNKLHNKHTALIVYLSTFSLYEYSAKYCALLVVVKLPISLMNSANCISCYRLRLKIGHRLKY